MPGGLAIETLRSACSKPGGHVCAKAGAEPVAANKYNPTAMTLELGTISNPSIFKSLTVFVNFELH
jgi:hypothetical protein